MKFLTIAAICALASSVQSLQFFGHLADTTPSSQNLPTNPPKGNQDHGHGHGPANKNDGKKGNQFDWKSWTNPCPNKDDKACWKQYFSTQLPCKDDDNQCWSDSIQKLPCPLGDKECWTRHVDTFPCKKNDRACWNQVLPTNLPCKPEQWGCWKKIIQGDNKGGKKGGKRHQLSNSSYDHDIDQKVLKSLVGHDHDIDQKVLKSLVGHDHKLGSQAVSSLFGSGHDHKLAPQTTPTQ